MVPNRPVSFAPWGVDWFSITFILAGGVVLILGIYLSARGGRDRAGASDHPGRPPLRNYAGIAQTDSNPMTVFIILFSVLIFIWAGIYVWRIAANGLWY